MNFGELVDLVDADGVIVRPRVSRREVKANKETLIAAGLYQPIVVVVALLRQEGRVIAQIRGPGKQNDGAGELDHVCGVIRSGESWHLAAAREAREEIGVTFHTLVPVTAGVNVYQRYRTLALGLTDDEPRATDPDEVASIILARAQELEHWEAQGGRLVRGFLDDMNLAMEVFRSGRWHEIIR